MNSSVTRTELFAFWYWIEWLSLPSRSMSKPASRSARALRSSIALHHTNSSMSGWSALRMTILAARRVLPPDLIVPADASAPRMKLTGPDAVPPPLRCSCERADARQVDARTGAALEDDALLPVPVEDRVHRVVDREDEAVVHPEVVAQVLAALGLDVVDVASRRATRSRSISSRFVVVSAQARAARTSLRACRPCARQTKPISSAKRRRSPAIRIDSDQHPEPVRRGGRPCAGHASRSRTASAAAARRARAAPTPCRARPRGCARAARRSPRPGTGSAGTRRRPGAARSNSCAGTPHRRCRASAGPSARRTAAGGSPYRRSAPAVERRVLRLDRALLAVDVAGTRCRAPRSTHVALVRR